MLTNHLVFQGSQFAIVLGHFDDDLTETERGVLKLRCVRVEVDPILALEKHVESNAFRRILRVQDRSTDYVQLLEGEEVFQI